MAKRRGIPSKAELLTVHERERLSNLLLSGATLNQVSLATGLSRSSINRYKQRVIVPAVKSAKYAVSEAVAKQAEQTAVQTATVREIAKQTLAPSPLRDRLDSLWQRIDKFIDDPKVADKSQLINQAHKNIELLGRATGELVEQSGTRSGSFQVMQVLMLPVTQPEPESAKIVDADPLCDTSDESST